MATAAQLTAAAELLVTNSGIFNAITQGAADAPDVETENGPVTPLAKRIEDLATAFLAVFGGGTGANCGFTFVVNESGTGIDIALLDQTTGTYRRIRLEGGTFVVVS